MAEPAFTRTEFDTTDTEMAHDYLSRIYAEHLPRLSGDRDQFRFRGITTGTDRYGVELLTHTMGLRTVVEPYGSLLVPHVLSGNLRVIGSRRELSAAPGQEFLIPHDARLAVQWSDSVSLGILRIDPDAVRKYAIDTFGVAPRFDLAAPVSAEHARYWRSVVRHVTRDVFANPAAAASPLVRTEVFHLLAATLLDTFGLAAEVPEPTGPLPSAVRRAQEFIEAHARTDVEVTDIAAAAGVSPRVLQAAFRRHLDITPLGYLRQVRLHGAHLDLRSADPKLGDTVAGIATAWGFTHLGRFAAAYRERYGNSPRVTLIS
jgi:AraC-like DNA-binding protein